jgi:hypothetical protein
LSRWHEPSFRHLYIDALPDRPVSEHPNLVISEGRALIEAALEIACRRSATISVRPRMTLR